MPLNSTVFITIYTPEALEVKEFFLFLNFLAHLLNRYLPRTCTRHAIGVVPHI